jgi:hypothetical protein
LIQVKSQLVRGRYHSFITRRSAMPVDSMLVAASVVLMFTVFAAVLAWGDTQTRQLAQQPNAKGRPF